MAYSCKHTRRMARRPVDIPVLGFGLASIGGLLGATSEQDSSASIERAWDLGIRHFDTAPQYGSGLAEHRLGHALRDKPRADWLLSTKVGRVLRPRRLGNPPSTLWENPLPFEVEFDYSYDATMRSLEDSMQRLGTDVIDLVLIHDVSVKWQGTQVGRRFKEAMSGAHKALDQLRASGFIQAFGIGLNDTLTATQFVEEGDLDFVMIAGKYTLLDASANETLIPACEKKSVGIMMAGPFNSGILATGSQSAAYFQQAQAKQDVIEKVKRLELICANHDIPVQAAALQFPLAHPMVLSVVTGFRTAHQVDQAERWLRTEIPDAFWAELSAAALDPAEAA
ncbi:aldo/keto reductase [Bordetella sp. BOR01]|uniref:aldo/keto reductase n=1 Tax=Bordetella sp. BOR01 TaxID=2854779 RepID=UPI001C4705A8|nr:aldo/keto reductase [Bordetella sp. BOR01]MBV7484387.1 aldo/keto reductase [Bordetella sp. BOR01]